MKRWYALPGLAIVALAIACSQPSSPASPSGAETDGTGAGPGGITLKVGAPVVQSPANGTLLSSLNGVTFVVSRVTGLNASFPITLEFDIARQGGPQIDNTKLLQGFSGSTTYVMNRQLEVNTTYTVRVRGVYQTAFGPWSDTTTFRTPNLPPARVTASEIFDPLIDGNTAGSVVGSVTMIPGVGAQLNNQSSHIRYTLTTPLEAGEISIMATNVDGTTPGDKNKVFAMSAGDDNITANPYRFTAEWRGTNYLEGPGYVTFRIIFGDGVSRDGERHQSSYQKNRWYLWRFTWRTGFAQLQVRADGPTGPVMYEQTVTGGTSPYRPQPHRVYIGAPVGQNGPIDASVPGMIVKNFWVSAQPRPEFPTAAPTSTGR